MLSREILAKGVGVLVLVVWLAMGVAELYVQQRLIRFYGTYELPTGEDRWNPRLYAEGAEVWLRRDRWLRRYDNRLWLALLVSGMGLSWLILHG